MPKSLFVLRSVSDFAPGAFENVAVTAGSIQLGRTGNEHLATGCYTSPAFTPDAFRSLVPSWNADTPPGTEVEVQARVSAGGRWSRWFSFGRWSPFINRGSVPGKQDEIAVVESDGLRLLDGVAAATVAQVRIFLYTKDAAATPKVWLLGAATKPETPRPEKESASGRVLEAPAYACFERDPSVAGRIQTPTALAMLMNRRGEDVLPEEVARAMYDNETGRFGNLAFISAAAGMYGYECYARFCGLPALRDEVRHGFAVGARVRYRAPALAEGEMDARHQALPLLEGATTDSFGHLVVVRGFFERDGRTHVVYNDPLAQDATGVRRELPAETFAAIYTGLCYMLHPAPRGAGSAKPVRLLTQMRLEDGRVYLSSHGEELLPGRTVPGDTSRSTIGYTLSDGTAYASAAQRKFYYVNPGPNGEIMVDAAAAAGRKITVYLVGSRGTTWVAEKMVEEVEQDENL